MKNRLLLSALAVALLFGACRKSNDLNPATPLTQESIDEIAKKDKDDKKGKDRDDDDWGRCDDDKKALRGSMAFLITDAYDLPCDCGTALQSAGTYKGSGNITHLGKTSAYFKPCIAPIFQGTVLVGYHVGIQCGFLKAANGDKIYVDIKPYDLMFTNTGAVGNVKVKITGGTGKFKRADGRFKAGTTNDGMGNVTLDDIKGSIDY